MNFFACKHNIYMLNRSYVFQLLVFDKKGIIKKVYWNKPKSKKDNYWDFIIIDKGNKKVFYFLCPDGKVDVYQIKI